jgi:hypothetical protein
MNIGLERIWKLAVVVSIKVQSIIRLQTVRETMKNLREVVPCSGRDSNPAPPEHKSEALLLGPIYMD